ncbi:hypothetical protein [Methanothermococcus okinawensis]|uniref:Uncharacterized protein n=1 Tax=Methanothermococcus okinawensis (strain DSM 14208 / JCM 11175 / IH1) TaxID=647113 RepID=F8ALV7_METOI|nr:hypothetical protein [Methanothermococcus okinawensis]AEH07514.1 hypothetical protein Metok_1551 [Methanothermococcus okinawensis IH1]
MVNILVNFIKNILERCGIKIFSWLLIGCLLLYGAYPEIILNIYNSTFKYIVMLVYGYSITALSFGMVLFNNTDDYIRTHKCNSFQTTEMVSKNIVDMVFNDFIFALLYFVLSIGSWYILTNIIKLLIFCYLTMCLFIILDIWWLLLC